MSQVVERTSTQTVEHEGEIWIVDYAQSFLCKYDKMTRAQVKANGGRILWTYEAGSERTIQMWQDERGRFFYGDDWYNDSDAILYPAYYSPF